MRGSTRSASGCATGCGGSCARRATRARSPAPARSSGCTTRKKKLSDYRSARPDDPQAPARTFLGLVNEGVLLSQRGLGACSLAMTDADVDRFVETLGRVLE